MGFIERELTRVSDALQSEPNANDYAELFSVQQALSWALDPEGFKPPMEMLRGIPGDSEDCPACLDPDQS